MADIVSPMKRSQMMAGIRGKNTKPEMSIRSSLHRRGYRFRLHRPDLPGTPDLVLPKHRAVVFVNGCFWHGHKCHLFKWPKSRPEFWRLKIEANIERDRTTKELLTSSGWRVARVWECAMKGKFRLDSDLIVERLTQWLESSQSEIEIWGG